MKTIRKGISPVNMTLARISHYAATILIATLLTLAALAPHVQPLLLHVARPGPDIAWHFHWSLQFAQGLSEGVVYPTWAPDEFSGLGAPTFLFYPPLFYYVVAGLHLAGTEIAPAMVWVSATSSVIASLLLYFLMKPTIGWEFALVSSMLLALSPFGIHLAQFQQFLPMYCAIPALTAYLLSISWPFGRLRLLLSATSLALLASTHVLTAFMALLTTAPIVFLQMLRLRGWIRFTGAGLLSLGSVALGLALAAFYLWPALSSTDLVTDTRWTSSEAWGNAFLLQYFTLGERQTRWFHLQWTISLAPVLILSLALLSLWWTRREKGKLWWFSLDFSLLAIIALFLGSEASYFLWRESSSLQMLQFPSRFLIIVVPASIIALGFGLFLLERSGRILFAKLAIASSLALSILLVVVMQVRLGTDAAPLNEAAGQSKLPPILFAQLPRTASVSAFDYAKDGALASECRERQVDCAVSLNTSHKKQWTVTADAQATSLRLPLLWFPGWEVQVNGEPVVPAWDPHTGLLMLDVELGQTDVTAMWRGLPTQKVGAGVTIASLIALVVVFAVGRRERC
jgi:hypothetical protein